MVAALKPCNGQDITFVGIGESSDREAVRFSEQIEGVLKQSYFVSCYTRVFGDRPT